MDRYYVQPRDGSWVARFGDEELGTDYSDRAAAMEAARDHRGDKREDIFRKADDGSFERIGVLVTHRGPEALWLLREDGTVYGEVDAEIREGGQPVVVNIAPVTESTEAPKDSEVN